MPRTDKPLLGDTAAMDSHRPMGDIVYERLRDAIIDRRLQPGQWLRQEALAQELGVSQMPVRDALKRLVGEGLAERIPYRGVRVVEFSPEDLVDMFAVRLVLESLAVRYATPLMTAADLARLDDNLRQAAQLTAPDQMAMRRELNNEFHLTIGRASGRRYLIRQLETLWSWFPSVMLYEGMRRQEDLSMDRLAREHQEHRELLDAIGHRDAARAEAVTRQHVHNLLQELAEVLDLPHSQTGISLPW